MRLRIYFGGASPNCGAGVRPYLIRRPALAHKNPVDFSHGSMSTPQSSPLRVHPRNGFFASDSKRRASATDLHENEAIDTCIILNC